MCQEGIKSGKKVLLVGYGMSVPRLGEAYTMTIQSMKVVGDDGKITEEIENNETGRVRQGEILNRHPLRESPAVVGITRCFTFTFSKITALKDANRRILIWGISPNVSGMYVEAEISYPNGYNPPYIA